MDVLSIRLFAMVMVGTISLRTFMKLLILSRLCFSALFLASRFDLE
jgi:hypothetical protein